jgi:hypothetical protein
VTVQEPLMQQLQESQQVAQQWQRLHGELLQFCTEKLMAATADAVADNPHAA